MSDQKNISPLLDGFTLGAPISEHHGVVCCPAIRENSNKKYIVKIISVPASQVQFDAMLLSGAYKDPGDAMEYFRDKGESILKEAELLKKLSKIEGFLSYEGWQMEPITRRRLGYEIYLTGSYKRSLDKYIRKNPFTHLEAVNLALDLCAALSVCRQAGYLYADLKPGNIFVSEKKEYRIGDLGFLSLDSLRYASLPERYFSPYTPPELLDPMEPVNLTVDTYAVGMIMYQLYNDGHLPFKGIAPTEPLTGPCHADYELAEIILKAIDPDPKKRWEDPKDLGKAIASYMQRNSVNDIPITPFVPLDVKPEDIVVISSQEEVQESQSEQTEESTASEDEEQALTEDVNQLEEAAAEPEVTADVSEQVIIPEPEEALQEVPVVTPEEEIPSEKTIEPEVAEEAEAPEFTEEAMEPVTESTPVVEPENISLPAAIILETDEQEEAALIPDISDEVAKILNKADDIIAHNIPQELVFPLEAEQEDPFAFALEEPEDTDEDIPQEPLMEEEPPVSRKDKKAKHFENTARKSRFKKFIGGCFRLLLLCGLCVGGFWYYQNIYLQPIDAMTVSGTQDQITVLVDTVVEESKLTVLCTDPGGKQYTASVQGGKATIGSLKPSTQYTVEVKMSGFHKLVGKSSDVFTTEAMTRILSFQAIAGPEDGSVTLDFTVEGSDPDFWNIRYIADGEEQGLETVTGHSATITGLSVGKLYTFTLDGGKNFDVSGETSVQYLASRLVLAENLHITTSEDGEITVHWNNPGDVIVESWDVRCYDGYNFEEQMTVTENQVSFRDLDPASHYTVEIKASGMTQPARIHISADPIAVSDFRVDESKQTELKLEWDFSGIDPEGGWQLLYTVDGSGSQELPCQKASATITPLIPGASYRFTLQAADGRTVFNNVLHHQAKEAEAYTANNFKLENVSMDLLKTPEESGWSFETVSEDAFTNSFSIGDSASMVLRSSETFYLPGSNTKILFVFRDAYGNALPDLTTEVTCIWKNIWMAGGDSKTGEIDLPKLPDTPGAYKMELYFDGCSVGQFDLEITD